MRLNRNNITTLKTLIKKSVIEECDTPQKTQISRRRTNNYKKNLKQKKNLSKESNSPFNSSLWSQKENALYAQFIQKNHDLMQMSKFHRKSQKVNQKMSKFIKTRSGEQCRSHHQKMMKYHNDIPSIISYVNALIQTKIINSNEPINFKEDIDVFHQQKLCVPMIDFTSNIGKFYRDQSYWEQNHCIDEFFNDIKQF